MKVNEVLNYNRIIRSIIDNEKGINSLIKFRLLGMCKQFEPVIDNFESIREEAIIKYGTATEDGSTGIIAPKRDKFDNDEEFDRANEAYQEAMNKYKTDLEEILNSEADIEIKKFKASDIMDAGLPSDYLVAIYDLIEE